MQSFPCRVLSGFADLGQHHVNLNTDKSFPVWVYVTAGMLENSQAEMALLLKLDEKEIAMLGTEEEGKAPPAGRS
jgi:hypothetical protein